MAPPETFLCEDLIIEILSRLPVKSLLRFRCISKSLKSLISNPIFVKLHLQRSQNNINLLLKFTYFLKTFSIVNDSLSTIVEDFDSKLKSKFKVVGSCNGLVCLVAAYSLKRSRTRYLVCLWNPSTNSKLYKVRHSVHSKYIFHPSPMFGFGYDSLSHTYKVVVVHFKNSKNNYESIESEVNVYDKRNNCWRNIQSFPGFTTNTQVHGIYLSGTINWLAISDLHHYWDSPLYIVSLDLRNETYTQLSLPSCFDQVHRVSRTKPCLGILKDRLCFSYDDVDKTNFVLWQMNEYGVENSWTQLLKLSYQALQIDCSTQESCILPPLGTLKNDHLILIESVDDRLRATILYKQEGDTEIPMNMLWLYTRDYVPSLIRPSQN